MGTSSAQGRIRPSRQSHIYASTDDRSNSRKFHGAEFGIRFTQGTWGRTTSPPWGHQPSGDRTLFGCFIRTAKPRRSFFHTSDCCTPAQNSIPLRADGCLPHERQSLMKPGQAKRGCIASEMASTTGYQLACPPTLPSRMTAARWRSCTRQT